VERAKRAVGQQRVMVGTPLVSSSKNRRADTPLSLRPRPLRHNVNPNI
jgi:hypothetical protein